MRKVGGGGCEVKGQGGGGEAVPLYQLIRGLCEMV
jgi:hypothetical protein